MTFYHHDCRLFTGYKPCKHKRPCTGCPHHDPVQTRIAIVSLDALGAVLRATCLLTPIRKLYPKAHITWVTYPNAVPLLDHNPMIDRIIKFEAASVPVLGHLEFETIFSVDKSLEAGALAESMKARHKKGFGLDAQGCIRPFNEQAHYQFDLGLDDELKFVRNQKPETQQITETMGMKWERDPYILELRPDEKAASEKHRAEILKASGARGIIGFNSGCSELFPYKKFTIERSIEVIRMWRQQFPHFAVALLGGREDEARQAQMKAAFAHDHAVVNTPTNQGLRRGIAWVNISDIVFSGDSLGMHIAIGLKKPVIAWFGLSCPQEIDLYDRGVKLLSDVACSPCWRKSCDKTPKCYDQVSVESIRAASALVLSRLG